MLILRTPSEHLALQYDAVGRTMDARRVRQGRLNAGERISLRAIEEAKLEALSARLRAPARQGNGR